MTKLLVVPIAATFALVALTNCQPVDDAPPGDTPPARPNASCPVVESRAWAAWVNAMPGPGATRELIATGEIVLPTPGYRATLSAGAADRSATPVQQLILDLTPPSGPVAQVLTTESVRYQGPAISMRYRAVRIMCGGQMLAEITDVPVAQ